MTWLKSAILDIRIVWRQSPVQPPWWPHTVNHGLLGHCLGLGGAGHGLRPSGRWAAFSLSLECGNRLLTSPWLKTSLFFSRPSLSAVPPWPQNVQSPVGFWRNQLQGCHLLAGLGWLLGWCPSPARLLSRLLVLLQKAVSSLGFFFHRHAPFHFEVSPALQFIVIGIAGITQFLCHARVWA